MYIYWTIVTLMRPLFHKEVGYRLASNSLTHEYIWGLVWLNMIQFRTLSIYLVFGELKMREMPAWSVSGGSQIKSRVRFTHPCNLEWASLHLINAFLIDARLHQIKLDH